MDKVVDSLSNAYQDFVTAAAIVLEAKEDPNALKTTTRDTSLENFKKKWDLFKVACDQADEFVDSARQRIESKCQVNEVIQRLAPGQAITTGLPPVARKDELQHGSGAGSANSTLSDSPAPFDARLSEDPAQ